MKGARLKGGTEATTVAIQEPAITTRDIKKNIHKTTSSDICRTCNTMPETISHDIPGCTTLAATSYLKRHNSPAKIIHLELVKKFNLIGMKETLKGYNYTPKKVLKAKPQSFYGIFKLKLIVRSSLAKNDIILQDKKDQQTIHHRYCNTSRCK